jgi:hypothetical protein
VGVTLAAEDEGLGALRENGMATPDVILVNRH